MADGIEEKIVHDYHDGGLQGEIFEQALQYMNSFGSIVLLFGVAISFINFFLLLVQYMTGFSFYIVFAITQKQRSILTLDRIKLELARMIGYSLLLLVASDILETLLKPATGAHAYDMDELYKMILIGGIRTTLAYFLGKETEEILHHIAHEEHSSLPAHHNDDEVEADETPPTTTTTTTPKTNTNTKSVTNATIVQKNENNNNNSGGGGGGGGPRGKNKRKQKKN